MHKLFRHTEELKRFRMNPIKRFVCAFLSFLLVLFPTGSASAISDALWDELNLVGAYYYDPQGGGVTCYSGSLDGDTIMAKLVSYLKGNNPTGFVLSDIGIAGIMANFEAESSFNPFRFQGDHYNEDQGYGIAQFTPYSKILGPLRTDPRTANYYNTYFDLKYTKTDRSTGFPVEPVPMEVVDAWLGVELDFFFGASSEFETTTVGGYRNKGGSMGLSYIDSSMTAHEAMDAARTPEDAARIFVWIMERPGDKEGAANRRGTQAQKWLNYVQQMSVSGGTTTGSTTTSGAQVTIIGDSITERSRAQLEQKLPGIDIHAQVSKQFYTGTSENPGGITILRDLVNNGSLRQTLVYALGTNGDFTSEQAQEVVDLAGSSRKVIFVNNWSTSNDYTTNNNVLIKMRNDNRNVSVVDWKTAIESQPETYLDSDGIHPNPEGQQLFAQLVASNVTASSSTLGACSALGLLEGGLDKTQAQKLADYYNSGEITVADWNLPMGTKFNCVSFVAFFVQRFTSVGQGNRPPSGWGDGRNVANNVAQAYGLPTGTEPRPYAVFSTTSGVSWCENHTVKCGHTGIVVGVNGNKVITVEASWGEYAHDGKVVERDLSYFVNTKYGYAFTYLDPILDQSDVVWI